MNIHLYTNVIKKYFLLIIPNTKSRYSNNTHVRLPGYNGESESSKPPHSQILLQKVWTTLSPIQKRQSSHMCV